MARVTIEDCLKNVENRFELVLIATKRSRQLMRDGVEPLVSSGKDKFTVIALREIAENLLVSKVAKEPKAFRDQQEQAKPVIAATVVEEET